MLLFTNNKDLLLQIRYVLVMADTNRRANILYWSSTKYKRVTRSVLAFELYGIAHGFNIGAFVKSTIDRVLGINLLLVLCTDSDRKSTRLNSSHGGISRMPSSA